MAFADLARAPRGAPGLIAWLLSSAGCAAGAAGQGAHGAAVTPRPVEVPRTVITPSSASSIPELLREAAALAAAERFADAAAAYDRAYGLEPEGAYGDEALWGAGDAYDRGNDLEKALARYQLLVQRSPGEPRAQKAMLRATRLLVFLGRYAPAGLYAERLLEHTELLGDFERIAVYSARALALLEQGEEERASYFIEKGRDIIDSRQLDAAGRVPRDLAQLYYALGESRRLKAERILFEPMPPNFVAVLEQRCQLLLDAQSAYSDAMRAYDAHWSAMAGFRTTELYERLHRDLMQVKPPPSAQTERERQLFEGAVRTRYAVLLTKAKGMAQHTLAMAERTGEHSEWVDRTKAALVSIDQRIADQQAVLDKLGYSQATYDAWIAEQVAKAGKGSAPAGALAPTPPRPKIPAAAP